MGRTIYIRRESEPVVSVEKCNYCEQDPRGFHEKNCPQARLNDAHTMAQEQELLIGELKELLERIYGSLKEDDHYNGLVGSNPFMGELKKIFGGG
jgi:glutaredoxin